MPRVLTRELHPFQHTQGPRPRGNQQSKQSLLRFKKRITFIMLNFNWILVWRRFSAKWGKLSQTKGGLTKLQLDCHVVLSLSLCCWLTRLFMSKHKPSSSVSLSRSLLFPQKNESEWIKNGAEKPCYLQWLLLLALQEQFLALLCFISCL